MRRYIIFFACTCIIATTIINCSKNSSKGIFTKNQQSLASLDSICTTIPINQLYSPAQQLKQEALRKNDVMYLAAAYSYLNRYFFFEYEREPQKETGDSIRIYGEMAKEFYIKAKRPDLALQPELNTMRWEVRYDNYEKILLQSSNLLDELKNIENKKIVREAYALLGTTYLIANSPKEALDIFKQELRIIRQLDESTEKAKKYKYHYYITVFVYLAYSSNSVKDWDMALAYCDSINFYSERYPDKLIASAGFINSNILTTEALIYSNRIKEARYPAEQLQMFCDSTKKENRFSTYYEAKTTLAQYYLKNGENSQALNAIEEAIKYCTITNNAANQNIAKTIKANILAAQSRYKDAFELEYQVKNHIDSLAKSNTTRQLTEMQTIYNTDKLKKKLLKQEIVNQRFILISISAIIVCIFLIIIFTLTRIKNNKIRKKNEKLLEQYALQLNLRSDKKHDKPEVKELSLYEKLEEYLEESHAYENPEINREFLASELGTNREYLIRAIQENTGMTFNEYINHHRLEYTCLLLYRDPDSTIKSIYISAGFNNERTFYRLFKQKYSMNPKEFRDAARRPFEKNNSLF